MSILFRQLEQMGLSPVDISSVVMLVQEIIAARNKHPRCPTGHHAMSVIREEYLELEREVFKQKFNVEDARREALHLAASALRLVSEHL